MNSVAEVFASHVSKNGKTLCLAPHDKAAWSREQTWGLTEAFADKLYGAGARQGSRVTVIVEKSPEAFLVYLACNLAGFVYHPANSAYTDEELSYLISDARPDVVICAPEREASIAAMGSHATLTLDQSGGGTFISAPAGESAPYTAAPDDWAALLYTSGTTGKPKGAMLSQGNLLSNAITLRDTWQFTDEDRLLHMLPIFHAHGLFVAGNTCLVAGAALLFEPAFNPDRFFERIGEATSFMAVPTLYGRLLKDKRLSADAVSHMRLFTSGSAPLDAVASDAFEAASGSRILERYGMTETLMLTSNPYFEERRAGTVGLPLPGVELRLRKDDGEIAKAGEIGIVEVSGPNVCNGYFNLPDKTKEVFTEDGYLITGDIGVLSEDGYLTLQGRSSDMIISGGYNVYPREVENVLLDIDGIEEVAVFGVPHPDFGEGVVAVIIGDVGLSEREMITASRERLANYKAPKRVLTLGELPKNAMGKVDRKILRSKFDGLFE
ncbi:MAG: AMP-binding protein [Pseudomonadota bacterium]